MKHRPRKPSSKPVRDYVDDLVRRALVTRGYTINALSIKFVFRPDGKHWVTDINVAGQLFRGQIEYKFYGMGTAHKARGAQVWHGADISLRLHANPGVLEEYQPNADCIHVRD